MKKEKKYRLDFLIDKLTNSIQNTISGDSFQTEVSSFTTKDLKQTTKKNGWNFNWKKELSNNAREVYKLTIVNNPDIIQGVISFTVKTDHIYLDLIESAPFNLGSNKIYKELQETWLHLLVKFRFSVVLTAFVHLQPNRN